MFNVEKSKLNPGTYNGYSGSGSFWKIHRDPTSRIWWAYERDGQKRVMHRYNLADISTALETL